MCGIFCILQAGTDENTTQQVENVKIRATGRLQRRGPDCQFETTQQLIDNSLISTLHGCTLHLRGVQPQQQPLIAFDSTFLLFNGEIFGGIKVPPHKNDAASLFEILQKCATEKSIMEVLMSIRGPWAVIYWQASCRKLWFGRDIFGRRSLLWTKQPSDRYRNVFALSSAVNRPNVEDVIDGLIDPQGWEEVPATGIFCLDVKCYQRTSFVSDIRLYKWETWEFEKCGKEHFQTWDLTNTVTADVNNEDSNTKSFSIASHEECLTVSRRVVPSVNRCLPTDADIAIFGDIKDIIRQNISSNCSSLVFETCLKNSTFKQLQEELEIQLQKAVETRVKNQTRLCQNCMAAEKETSRNFTKCCKHAKVAVLFSGGLDSTILCVLADRFVPNDEPIDLLNVAFEQRSKDSIHPFNVPDRITGCKALEELKLLCKSRQWNFVEINITKSEMNMMSEKHVSDLVYPLITVLDNDIGSAVWFAARGQGQLLIDGKYTEYTSPSRVVLTGIGADEQFGGYSRHRACYIKDSWQGLVQELQMEVNRISRRNLGRDDRVIGDHGREARFPYLDEELVNFVSNVCISYKVNLDLERGIGDKLLLRILAFRLGLVHTASFEKRAIQFGSRIAKMENSRNGADICHNLQAKK